MTKSNTPDPRPTGNLWNTSVAPQSSPKANLVPPKDEEKALAYIMEKRKHRDRIKQLLKAYNVPVTEKTLRFRIP